MHKIKGDKNWGALSVNLVTGVVIYKHRYRNSLYKVRGYVFADYTRSIRETEEHGNAAMKPIAIGIVTKGEFKRTYSSFAVYDRKGVNVKRPRTEVDALSIANDIERKSPAPKPDLIERRRKAYHAEIAKRMEALKRKKIERAKIQIKEERRLKARDAKVADHVEREAGSW